MDGFIDFLAPVRGMGRLDESKNQTASQGNSGQVYNG